VAQLRRDFQKLKELNTYLFPILTDNKKNAIKMQQKYARIYPIFYDEKKEVTEILKQEIKISKLGRIPGLLIIDKQGVIRYAYYSDNMHDIPENREILDELKKINN